MKTHGLERCLTFVIAATCLSSAAKGQLPPQKKTTSDSVMFRAQSIAARAALIPDVVGKSETDAINALVWTKLSVVRLDSMISSGSTGFVLAQRPRAGTPVSGARAETLFVSAKAKPARPKIDLSELLGQIVSSTIVQDRRRVPVLRGRTPAMVAAALEKS